MAVLYLIEQGAKLHKDGDVFTITKDDEVLEKVHAVEVEQVIVLGNISLTTPVIDYLLQNGIDCVFCNSVGKYHGRLTSTESRLGSLRLRQSAAVLDTNARLLLARAFVRGKLQNCRTIMMRYRRELDLPVLDDTIKLLDNALQDVVICTEINSLLGIEGGASAAYYKSFREILKRPMGFTARVRRPPTDPVNSILSFGYTLLTYNIQAALSIVGFDPFIGYLHSVEQPRANLALDMVEEFRPVIVDSLVLWLVNTGVMTEADFELPPEPGQMVRITKEGLKKVIHHYEMRVQSKIYHARANGQTSYRHCFEMQARELAAVLNNQTYLYKPFLVR